MGFGGGGGGRLCLECVLENLNCFWDCLLCFWEGCFFFMMFMLIILLRNIIGVEDGFNVVGYVV